MIYPDRRLWQTLEEISIQNGPPKKNNKIIVKIIFINFGGRKEKKLIFLFVFSTYLPVILLKFRLGEIIGCNIKLCIQ